MVARDLALSDPSFASYTPPQLVAGESPSVATSNFTVLDGQTLDQYEVVALNAAGKVVVWDPTAVVDIDASGDTANVGAPESFAIGFMAYASSPSGADGAGQVVVAGCFNHAALVWPAAIDTYIERQNAFSRTPILIRSLVG